MTNTLITIVGPTAIGKTTLSIELAKHFNTAIISCDSRQFYKEMSIGTAVPEPEELAVAPHYFIQNKSIFDNYNVGEFERDALATLDTLFLKNKVVIMVGGSGLYADAVTKGLDSFPKVSPEIRRNLTQQLQEKGIESLQKQLQELDIEAYNTIAIDNPQRLTRALEICIGSGKTYSSFKNKSKITRNFNTIKIGLQADRTILYDRINKRVEMMVEKGLFEEAKKLYQHKDLNALQTVGYREIFNYFDGTFTKDFAISEIQKNTRRFAKRQLTWYRKDNEINWFDYQYNLAHIINTIQNQLK